MAEHRTSRWRRLRDSIAIDPGHFAAGSAVIDTLGLLAFEAEKLAVRRQSERPRRGGRARDCERSAENWESALHRVWRHRVRN
jgi:GAF domain-containing protein